MSSSVLASCGAEVKVWSLATGPHDDPSHNTPLVTFKPHSQSIVNAVQFNQRNTVVITVGEDGYLCFTHTDGQPYFQLPQITTAQKSPRTGRVPLSPTSPKATALSRGGAATGTTALPALSCLSLVGTSRFVCCGGASIISIWDIQKRKISKVLEGHQGEVTCLDVFSLSSTNAVNGNTAAAASLSPSSWFSASGSDSGNILIHNCESGSVRATLSSPFSSHPVRCVQFAPNAERPTLLLSGGDDGQPMLWDINKAALARVFPATQHHSASISCMRYSHSIPAVFVSCSLDACLMYHDLNSNSVIRHVSCEAGAITACDWHEDGYTLAVGCSTGNLVVYDTRMPDKPIKTIEAAHKGEVRGVAFQHKSVGTHKTKVKLKAAEPSLHTYRHNEEDPVVSPSHTTPSDAYTTPAAQRTKQNNAANKQPSTTSNATFLPFTPASTASSSSAVSSAGSTRLPVTAFVAQPVTLTSASTTAKPTSRRALLNTTTDEKNNITQSTEERLPSRMSNKDYHDNNGTLSPDRTSSPINNAIKDGPTTNIRRSANIRRTTFPTSPSQSTAVAADTAASLDIQPIFNKRPVVPSKPERSEYKESIAHVEDHIVPSSSPTSSHDSSVDVASITASITASFSISLDARLSHLYDMLKQDVTNIHLDMFRQFHAQSVEQSQMMTALQQQNEALRQELRTVQQQLAEFTAAHHSIDRGFIDQQHKPAFL